MILLVLSDIFSHFQNWFWFVKVFRLLTFLPTVLLSIIALQAFYFRIYSLPIIFLNQIFFWFMLQYTNFHHWSDVNAPKVQGRNKNSIKHASALHTPFPFLTHKRNIQSNFLPNSTHFLLKKRNRNWSRSEPTKGHKSPSKTSVQWVRGEQSDTWLSSIK